MPLVRRLPKRGFTHIKKSYTEIVNLGNIDGVFKENDIVTPELLKNRGLIKKAENVKILGEGAMKKKMEIHAHSFSSRAKEIIEKTGGKAIKLQPVQGNEKC